MPDKRDSSGPGVTANPRIFCGKCGYALVGLESGVCPECGRAFDPGNRRTFARKPPRFWVWRWGRRVLALGLLLGLAAGAGVGWLWWGWHAEQPTIARLRALQADITLESIGPERFGWLLGARLGHLRDRVERVFLYQRRAAEIEPIDFQSLTYLERLDLADCELSDRVLNNVGEITTLHDLFLSQDYVFHAGFHADSPNMGFLARMPQLTQLTLEGIDMGNTGLAQVSTLKHLVVLNLRSTGISTPGLKHLQRLPALEELELTYAPVTDAGLEYLKDLKSLRCIWIYDTDVTPAGVGKLRNANPNLRVEQSRRRLFPLPSQRPRSGRGS